VQLNSRSNVLRTGMRNLTYCDGEGERRTIRIRSEKEVTEKNMGKIGEEKYKRNRRSRART